MIIFKEGKMIDTCNMNNNHLYTYVSDNTIIYKVEVNFELYNINDFMKELKEFSEEKEGYVDKVKYDVFLKKPIEEKPYDEIKEFLCKPEDKENTANLLENVYIHNVYLKWNEYPSVYHELKELIDFKTQPRVGKEKSIDLNHYLEKLEKYDLKQEFLQILKFDIRETIEKNKLEGLLCYDNNGFVDISKAIENAQKYLEYGQKNAVLIKKLK
ncbi:MAG: hypothetical protein J6K21_02255 [Bacilli bacterium]|nr:hypothetical protein [Bacilli bacterium]